MRYVLGVLLALASLPALALQIETIEGAGWQARGLRLQLSLAEGDARGEIRLAEIRLPELFGSMRNLRFDCDPLIVEPARIACLNAPLTAEWDLLDAVPARASFQYTAATGQLQLKLHELKAVGGQLSLRYQLDAEGWQAKADLQGLQAERLAPLLEAAGKTLSADAGQLQGQIEAHGDETQLSIDFDLGLSDLTAYDAAGELASEALSLQLAGTTAPFSEGWRARLQLNLAAGQLYVNPVFMELTGRPLKLAAGLDYLPGSGELHFDDLQLDHRDTLTLSAAGQLQLKPAVALENLRVSGIDASMATAYPVYLQPFLIDLNLGELETGGRVQGEMQLRDGGLHGLALRLADVTLHDRKQRFSVDALNGLVNWSARGTEAPASELHWSGGSAYRLPFGASTLHWQASAAQLQLLRPFSLPLLGGALQVSDFSAVDLGSEARQLAFDGALQPISLKALTRALGWPEFAGNLSGQLPDLSYRDGSLTVGGTLAAEVFDGRVQVDGLRIDNPFGRLPRLAADVRLRNLDLAQATSAFDFGAIEGRLDGDVKGLRLLNWQPAAFEAAFYTPPDDDSRHRISQRAIENISSLGGAGAGAALSRGFMRFFENFAYDRLGISCRLANAVCLMGGIEPAPDKGGYYLVKGKLLPRIDVIGYAREVSWPALTEQLQSITAGEGPIVR